MKIIKNMNLNGTWQHFLLGVLTVALDLLLWQQIHTAIAVMIGLELVQWDTLKYLDLQDTIHDLLLDTLGGLASFTALVVILDRSWSF